MASARAKAEERALLRRAQHDALNVAAHIARDVACHVAGHVAGHVACHVVCHANLNHTLSAASHLALLSSLWMRPFPRTLVLAKSWVHRSRLAVPTGCKYAGASAGEHNARRAKNRTSRVKHPKSRASRTDRMHDPAHTTKHDRPLGQAHGRGRKDGTGADPPVGTRRSVHVPHECEHPTRAAERVAVQCAARVRHVDAQTQRIEHGRGKHGRARFDAAAPQLPPSSRENVRQSAAVTRRNDRRRR
eukprot:472924-Pleurochrysis_carterae.AAC.3